MLMQREENILLMLELKVLLSTYIIKSKILRVKKPLPRWIGHVRIMKRVDNVAYKLELP